MKSGYAMYCSSFLLVLLPLGCLESGRNLTETFATLPCTSRLFFTERNGEIIEGRLVFFAVAPTSSKKLVFLGCLVNTSRGWMSDFLQRDIKKDFLPERKAKIRSKTLPWMNAEIRKSMNQRYNKLRQAQN